MLLFSVPRDDVCAIHSNKIEETWCRCAVKDGQFVAIWGDGAEGKAEEDDDDWGDEDDDINYDPGCLSILFSVLSFVSSLQRFYEICELSFAFAVLQSGLVEGDLSCSYCTKNTVLKQ